MAIKLFVLTFSFMLFSINCKSNNGEIVKVQNKFKESKQKFEKARDEFDKCKNDYEKSTNHKIVIDIKNGSGISGAAEEVSDYLRELCYDTYYSNLIRNNIIIANEYYTKIDLHNQDSDMGNQLKKDLDKKIKIKNKLNSSQGEGVDITLIIGKDYKSLDFYSKIKK